MDFDELFTKGMIAFIVLLFVGAITLMCTQHFSTYSTFHPIYKATVPFGMFTVNGDIGGGILFIHGSLSDSETYLIKYFENDELLSVEALASETPIIIDGTFQLEAIHAVRTQWFLFYRMEADFGVRSYKIHIPYLPKVNSALTEDWIK